MRVEIEFYFGIGAVLRRLKILLDRIKIGHDLSFMELLNKKPKPFNLYALKNLDALSKIHQP